MPLPASLSLRRTSADRGLVACPGSPSWRFEESVTKRWPWDVPSEANGHVHDQWTDFDKSRDGPDIRCAGDAVADRRGRGDGSERVHPGSLSRGITPTAAHADDRRRRGVP